MGKPLFADRNTSEQRHLGYARVCVEVKVDSTLFEEIPVKYANGYVHYQKDTGKAVVIEEGVATSSGSLQFGAIDQATLLPTPVGSVCNKPREARPDTPVGRGVLEVPVWQLSPIGEDDSGEEVAQASGSKGGGSVGKNKKKGKGNGRVVVPPPKPA
ncbi:hypothetical protein LIER_38437 [Lithospermum erythrorhizon]|uniref:Uncharacterized protein n=1 Tax=Lithospermum erythrorhizon TaxID=34254 RepID=A0AAV3Q3X7_LITER